MSKIIKRTPIRLPTVEEDRVITSAAKSDPDAQPLTPKQLKAMVPLRTLRGRPKSENRKLLILAESILQPMCLRKQLILLLR